MGKLRYGYGIWSNDKDGLKSRAEIPTSGNITTYDGTPDYIDCVNIMLSQVRDILAESTYSVYELCRSDAVNRWSQWCPVTRSITGSYPTADFVNSKPSIARLGDFAGYNHGALTPGWQTGGQATAQATIWVNVGSTAQITCPICIGEIDWYGEIQAEWIVVMVFNSGDLLEAWSKTDVATIANNATVYCTTGTMSSDTSGWYGRIVICDTEGLSQGEDIESAFLCRVPNITTFTVQIKVKQLSTLTLNGTAWNNTSSQTVGNVSFTGISFNTSAGTVTIGDCKDTTSGLDGLRINIQVLNWLDEEVANGDIYNYTIAGGGPVDPYGTYITNYWIVFDGGWVDPIPTFDAGSSDYSYGYRFILSVLEHAS